MKIWAKTDGDVREGKYLVVRRDGTVPKWGHFVISTIDPASADGLRGYAAGAERLRFDPEYVESIRDLASDAERLSVQAASDAAVLGTKGADPDAGPHRKDCPAVIEMMRGNGDVADLVSQNSSAIALLDEVEAVLTAVCLPYQHLTTEALEAGILMEFGPPKLEVGAAILSARALLAKLQQARGDRG